MNAVLWVIAALLAVAMHLRRKEIPAPAPSGALLILAATVAWGRFGPYAF